MDSYIKTKAWSLQYNLSHVQSALIDCGMQDIEKKIREYVEVLRYYSLLIDFPGITTITGPQGVGKSYHTNQMCEIPENQRLLSNLGRGEKIPVFLFKKSQDESCEVRIFKRSTPTETGAFVFEDITFSEARVRVSSPENDDLCAFWYADGNSFLETIAPIAILPGFEIGTPWEMAINVILDLSDSIIYVVDQSRSAQLAAEENEKKISQLNLKTPAVALLSGVDEMSTKRIEEFSKQFSFKAVPVGIVSSEIKNESERVICTQQQYNNLLGYLGEYIATSSSSRKSHILETTVDRVMMYLEDARTKIDNLEVKSSVGILRVVDKFLEGQNEIWNIFIRPVIMERAEKVCENAVSGAHKAVGPLILQDSFPKKFKLFVNGGVTLDFTNQLKNTLISEFSTRIESIESSVLLRLKQQSKERTLKLLEGESNSFYDIVKTGQEIILFDAVTTPLSSVDQKMNSNLATILKSGNDAMQEISGAVETAGGITNNLHPVINALAMEKGKKAIFDQINKLPNIEKTDKLKSLITAGFGAGGAAASGAEIAGAGFAGATMSVVAGVLGAAVVGLSIGSFIISITRNANKTEFMLDDFVKKCAQTMSNQVQADVSSNLDRFWECYKYQMKHSLLSDTGVGKETKWIIELATSTHLALEDSKELIKSLGFANAD